MEWLRKLWNKLPRGLRVLLRYYKHETINFKKILVHFFTWIWRSFLTGVAIGLVGIAFRLSLDYVTQQRQNHDWLFFLLPVGGVLIVFLYHVCGFNESRGTNLILSAIRMEEKVPFLMAPLIFVSTLITHLTGGSAGREGAALQIGGSLAQWNGRIREMDDKDINILTMCGMSACFSALFGTPIGSAIFAIEVISVGVMYYSSLLPCAVSAITASYIAHAFSLPNEFASISTATAFNIVTTLQVLGLAAGCALISVLFCRVLKLSHKLLNFIKSQYFRILLGSALIIGIVLLSGNRSALGAGLDTINQALSGVANWQDFVLKILLTAVTIAAGFKGGEIVPAFFVGAVFGCWFGDLIGMNPSFAAGVGMISVFCGVTNCPLASLLMACELFGYRGIPYFLLAIAVSYLLSGYSGFYSTQKIVYSKYKPEFINIHTK